VHVNDVRLKVPDQAVSRLDRRPVPHRVYASANPTLAVWLDRRREVLRDRVSRLPEQGRLRGDDRVGPALDLMAAVNLQDAPGRASV
jgi:hypothetical protein